MDHDGPRPITLAAVSAMTQVRGQPAVLEYFGELPVLVVPAGPQEPAFLEETPLEGSPVVAKMMSTTARDTSAMLASLADGRCLAVPLSKSGRNTFGMLVTIGRSARNDVRLLSPSVSKLHATVRRAPTGPWVIRDAGSRNGTLIGSVRLAPEQESPLTPGCTVQFGSLTCMFLDARGLIAMCGWMGRRP
jgi:hypothetical protein